MELELRGGGGGGGGGEENIHIIHNSRLKHRHLPTSIKKKGL